MEMRSLTKTMLALTVAVLVAVVAWGGWVIWQAQQPRPQAPVGQAVADLAAAAASEPGAVVLPSGLVFRSVQEGTGRQPRASDTVRVHYRGVLANGQEFDSSYQRGQPAEFPLGQVIPCWTEGVQRIKAGGKAKLTCPAGIAYGERGVPGTIPSNATLQFEVELLAVMF